MEPTLGSHYGVAATGVTAADVFAALLSSPHHYCVVPLQVLHRHDATVLRFSLAPSCLFVFVSRHSIIVSAVSICFGFGSSPSSLLPAGRFAAASWSPAVLVHS
ncbi:hypothetical protein PIB30_007424 [Stylosanthes scabra]|uniref:Uncharacterized protein n=1 Tax=Stylosanthes scabra TaxID=79078 RepID=A0ABU6Q4L5_9FABA|nr:hypothetical protein [Stylosanthes scabra]